MKKCEPDFSAWTLHELLLQPWIDSKTIEGADFWISIYGRAAQHLKVNGLHTPKADAWIAADRGGLDA
jgi:hypothetical protein